MWSEATPVKLESARITYLRVPAANAKRSCCIQLSSFAKQNAEPKWKKELEDVSSRNLSMFVNDIVAEMKEG
jgi:hypothetical protein